MALSLDHLTLTLVAGQKGSSSILTKIKTTVIWESSMSTHSRI